MANPERGEVALTVGDRVYTLVLDFNAYCELEELLSTPDARVTWAQAIWLAIKDGGSAIYQRAMVWASLRRYHKDLSLDDVSDLIQSVGGFEALVETMGKLRKASEPEGEARPRKARQATKAGARTTSTPAA
jgi:hypothetical protein